MVAKLTADLLLQ